jgi:ferredoxin-NADP reductase
MKEYKVKLQQRIKRTATVESFRFRPQEKIDFLPGQFLEVFFDEAHRDNSTLNKYLSFSSSPTKDYIEVTKRLSGSEFSGRLRGLREGEEVMIKAPIGASVFREEYKKIGFLTGGIGITPVISIIEYIVEKGLNTDVVLLYSNRTDEDIAFKQELDGWAKAHHNLRVVYTVTGCQPKDARCLAGRIDDTLVQSKIPDARERMLYSFGPPGMVESMTGLCRRIGCDEEKVIAENFTGY